ncbi:MAG: transcriptional regulator [Methanophagales archaeon ANME-1-THS]|nr:MAG: transcriptional regulator [Methanophagales archaeon ANME-1-THS]
MDVGKNERRDRFEILSDILLVARHGAGKTEIVYKANLNFKRVKSYLNDLEEMGLLENSGSVYTSTERGREFVHSYQTMKERCTKRD